LKNDAELAGVEQEIMSRIYACPLSNALLEEI
jgi:hypothetical protein